MLKVITFSDKDVPMSRNWKKSMNLKGYDSIILSGKWVNFITKIKATLDYIKTITHKYIIFLDCYDAFAYKDKEGLIDTFLSFDSDIVVSAENYSLIGRKVTKWQDRKRGKYVNSGFYMGYREKVIKMLEWITQSGHTDDQVALCDYIESGSNTIKIELDSDFKLCYLSDCPPFSPYTLKRLNSYFVHCPASSYDGYLRYNMYGSFLLSSDFEKIDLVDNKNKVFFCLSIIILSLFLIFYTKYVGHLFLLLFILVLLIYIIL